MPSEPFDVCWQRIDRARVHSHAIAAAWEAFLKEEPYDTAVDVDDDGTGSIWIEQVKSIPSVIALEIGELLYQLRAALDACIYEAACVNSGCRPPANEHELEFPFCVTPDRFRHKNTSRKIAPLTDKQRAFVESVQAYSAPAGLTKHERAFSFNRCLNILNDWARKDRHRQLHVVGSWVTTSFQL